MDRIGTGASNAPLRPFTVQCGFAAYHANTVVVEAADARVACRLAIEVANQSDGWKAIDHCGPTFVDTIAEGEEVDPWAGLTSALPVPTDFAEPDAPTLRAALVGLLDWAAMMGGWEAEAWRAAERAVGRSADSATQSQGQREPHGPVDP